jgi:AcrR family transcriptional regulator
MNSHGTSTALPQRPPPARTRKQEQTAQAKHKICRAVVSCLDEFGYAETSINRVQAGAGVSRGALTHHFPSKEEMMVETVERLLDPVRDPLGAGKSRSHAERQDSVESDLMRLWSKAVNTPEGRALVEILVAARTDTRLQRRIAPSLARYNDDINQGVLAFYASVDLDDADVVTLWTICRVFLRGLHIQERFDGRPEATSRIMSRFADIIGPHLHRRTTK